MWGSLTSPNWDTFNIFPTKYDKWGTIYFYLVTFFIADVPQKYLDRIKQHVTKKKTLCF